MITFQRTNSENPDFIKLVRALDIVLAARDGDEHPFFDQYNKLDSIKHVVVAYHGNQAVGCGAIKEYADKVMEIKRMYVRDENRGQGIASAILLELENWARELHCQKCILETGIKHPDAVQLYRKNNYTVIPNYGQYVGVELSICFEKLLIVDC